LTISDNGCWKPADDSPGHRGHGLLLMRALVDSVDVTTGPDGTNVTMVKELSR
jgi:anti-sigma regulatory factor (Ser/Thr protein kinase)